MMETNGQYQQQQPSYPDQVQPPPGPPPQKAEDGGHNNPDYNAGPANNGYNHNSKESQTFDQAFQIQRPKWNDIWAGLLFIGVFLGFAAVSGISINGYLKTPGHGGGVYGQTASFGLTTETMFLFGYVIALAFVFSLVYVWLARLFTKQFIWITGILNIAFGLATAIYMLYHHQWVAGFIFLAFVVFLMFCFWTWIPRIPFSALMLQTSIDVAKNYGHVFLVSAVGGFLASVYAAWYAVTLSAVYVKYAPVGDASWSKVTGLAFFVSFAAYWFTEWLKNTIHTTICGVYGSWYYNVNSYPRKVTRGALRRSLTYSFGSISLGSLIVSLINLLRTVLDSAMRQAAAQGDIFGTIIFCIGGCLVGLVQWAAQFVNRYAFAHIALYGKPYFTAAKDTWRMIKDRGIDALVNECLIGPVLSFGCTFVGYACALLAYLYLIISKPTFNSNGDYTGIVITFSFLIGLQICAVFTTPLSSGIDTIFVAAAWDPEVMMRDHPDFYQQMIHVYPHVQQAIHV